MSAFLAAILEQAGNRLLRLDPESARRLGELDGKVIRVRLTDGEAPTAEWYLLPSPAGVRVLESYTGEPDVTVSASGEVFARLLLADDGRPRAAGEMSISGDIALGQRFQHILRELDLDWEEALAGRVGDVVAHRIGNAVRSARQWLRHAQHTLATDATEYLQEEARLLATRRQVEAFLSAVDTLRADVSRLEKRIARLWERS